MARGITVTFILVYQVLLIDLGSILYASLVVPLLFQPPTELFWPLWFAKYQGFAINLAVTVLLLCITKNLKKLASNRLDCLKAKAMIEHRFNCPRLTLNRSHAIYTYRVLLSSLLHTLMHALFTHPFQLDYDERFHEPITMHNLLVNHTPAFNELTFGEQAKIVLLSFVRDSHTWTGYALLTILAGPILFSGLRLAKYAHRHFDVLQAHRAFAYLTLPLIVYHHPIYFWPALWLGLGLVDYLLGALAYTERCTVLRATRFPNYQLEDEKQENDVIDISFHYSQQRLENVQPGNYVRINVPTISRFEWHDFTLMRTTIDNVGSHARVHLTIRSVGRWTKRFYRTVEQKQREISTDMLVKGPYATTLFDPTMHRITLSNSLRFEIPAETSTERKSCCRWLDTRCVQMPDSLVLVCSGTAITHFMSILDTLIPLYYNGYVSNELPRKIVVCWTVRTIFNLNFALIPLSRYQRSLAVKRLDDLLVYEFFVSQLPEHSDVLCAQMFRRMLMATQQSLLIRNSRLSTLDITTHDRVNTALGSRINFQNFGERHLAPHGERTLIMLNTAVPTIQREFEQLARQYKCRLHTE